VKNKNFSLLINAYAQAEIQEDLVILGAGDEEESLKALAAQSGLSDRVHFLGFKGNPYPYILNAEYFVSTSNAEGFPNAIVEAMCLEKAVIATNCESGPAEIIAEKYPYEVKGASQEKHGILCEVDSVKGVTEAIRMLADLPTRKAYAINSKLCAESFSYSAFREKVVAVIEQVTS
jgi:N-acetylgalactosamine-N,N'-diacetylbacillosaminyl-diphospho-undecaprenol 4-alpha-N-acetylgalactosaminyltransferase